MEAQTGRLERSRKAILLTAVAYGFSFCLEWVVSAYGVVIEPLTGTEPVGAVSLPLLFPPRPPPRFLPPPLVVPLLAVAAAAVVVVASAAS